MQIGDPTVHTGGLRRWKQRGHGEKHNAVVETQGRDKYRRGADRETRLSAAGAVVYLEARAGTWGMVTQTFHSLMFVLSKRMSRALLPYLMQNNEISISMF